MILKKEEFKELSIRELEQTNGGSKIGYWIGYAVGYWGRGLSMPGAVALSMDLMNKFR